MRVTTFILTSLFLSMQLLVASPGKSQDAGKTISLSLNNVTFSTAIRQIQRRANVAIMYELTDRIKNDRVTLSVKNKTVPEILDQLIRNKGLRWDYKKDVYRILDASATITPPGADIKSPPLNLPPITGIVRGPDGQPLAGVNVVVKGTTKGAVTDASGRFSVNVAAGDVIEITYVGFDSQDITITAENIQKPLSVSLTQKFAMINDVVVVGYGTQKKLTVTGAVSTVNTEQLRQSSSASLANALAGRLSGLTSIQSGGAQPGRDDATMYLRGAATTNGKEPLILIDGVPRDNIRTIDPNEVASVSVLKDASSTAVFGVRGANGVILITTRRGSAGKTTFTINAEQSFSSFTREPERLHSLEYMNLRNEATKNDGITDMPFSQEQMDKYANPLAGLDQADPEYEEKARLRRYMYPDHDYYREYIARSAPQTRVNLSASGGTNKLTYFVNAVYLHQGGNLKTEPKSVLGYDASSWMDRYSFRANLDYVITKSLKAFLNIGSYIEQVNMPAAWLYGDDTNWMMRDLIYQSQTILPITPGPTTIDGFGVPPGQIVDPGYMDRSAFEIMNRMGYRNEVRSNFNSTVGLDWDLGKTVTKGLSVKGMVSYDSKATTAMQGNKSELLYLAIVNPATDELGYAVKRGNESLLTLVKGADSRYNINLQGSVNYKRLFGRHDIGAMALVQRDTWESTRGEIPFNVVGLAGRVTYGYDDRYLAEVNLGYNGSEQFAPGNRFGFFPAVSAGWVASNEAFMQSSANIITNLKFRASYGRVGNDILGANRESSPRFLYQDNITMGGGPLGSLGLGQGINQALLGNPGISWELAEKQNFGLDLGLFRDLSLSFDYFTESRSKILISRGTVPEFQGVPLGNIPKANLGEVDNKGYEIEVTYNKRLSTNFSLMFRGNYGYNHNVVRFFDEARRDETYAHRYRTTGYSLGQSWGYKVDYSNGNGYFNSEEELDTYLAETNYSFGAPRVGDLKYIDLNGDGVIDDKDQAPIGYSNIPRITYGALLSLQYKGFNLTTFFQGVGKYTRNYSDQGVYEYIIRGTYFGYHKTAWTPERYASGEKITYPALSTHTTTNHRPNEFFIMDRSFIRLKNIELAYTLPVGSLTRLGVQNLRLYVSGQNLFTWDKLRMDHLDPENDDSLGYPVTRMANFGVNITF